jgi:DNA-binding NarL/FixJ family response regulator
MFDHDFSVYSMTPAERCRASILLVETDTADRANLKASLRSLGFVTIIECHNHPAAIDMLSANRFTHVIYEAKKGALSPEIFASRVMDICGDDTIVIALSHEPRAPDVVGLVTKGVRGYLRKPFSVDLVEQAVEFATKGDPIHEAVINATDLNEALLSVVVASVDRAAELAQLSTRYYTASREVAGALQSLRRAVYQARTFAEGGEEGYLSAMERYFKECSEAPASRLGKLRKRLLNKRDASVKKKN